jgi:CRP-like cAMP-binding protein
MVTTQVLREFELFKDVNDDELTKIGVLCNERSVDEGTLLFKQGNKATNLHLCHSGHVDIIVRLNQPHGIEVTVHKAKKREVLGWSSLVEPYVYTASARCTHNSKIIYIEAAGLIDLFKENTHLGYIFMRNLSTVISSRLAEYRYKFSVELALAIKKEW